MRVPNIVMRSPINEQNVDNEDQSSSEISGNKTKITLILLLALITFVSVGNNVRGYLLQSSSDDNTRVIPTAASAPARKSAYKPLITYVYNSSTPSSSRRSNNSYNTAVGSSNNQQIMSKDSLPIYLLQSSTNQTAVQSLFWGVLNKQWNRTTQYDDLLQIATSIPSLPSAASNRKTALRPVVMIHCGPKTGSTTLRNACRFNLEKTCGVSRKTNGHYPEGYMDETKLYPLIRRCTDTFHFCAKEVIMPADVPTYEDVLFIHMFPFRQYDEWTKSALKQQYDRGREKGCNNTKSLLEDDCKPNRMEIDFRKYGKTELSKFKEGVVQRMKDREEQHVFLLYHHRELHNVLEKLSDVYNIPLLPGSDGKGKEVRPEGTCDGMVLDMFHDCFSSELMELT